MAAFSGCGLRYEVFQILTWAVMVSSVFGVKRCRRSAISLRGGGGKDPKPRLVGVRETMADWSTPPAGAAVRRLPNGVAALHGEERDDEDDNSGHGEKAHGDSRPGGANGAGAGGGRLD